MNARRRPVRCAAIDLGSSSGRVVLGTWTRERLDLREIHRFSHVAKRDAAGSLRWDLAALLDGIDAGLYAAARVCDGALDAISLDTWGVDYALRDARGTLLGNPHSYRDERAARWAAACFQRVSREEVFARTGVEPALITTALQLFADLASDPSLAQRIARVEMLPELFYSHLGAARGTGATIASTSALAEVGAGSWSGDLIEKLGFDPAWFSPIRAEACVAGHLCADMATRLGLPRAPLILAGTHDTAAAVRAALGPHPEPMAAFLSCGSWSLLGVSANTAAPTRANLERGITHEVGVSGQVLTMKNLIGLWPLQQALRVWQSREPGLTASDVARRASAVPVTPFTVDLSDPQWAGTDDVLPALAQAAPRHVADAWDVGTAARVLIASLAQEHARAVADIELATGRSISQLHMVGGGVHNELLCQLTADATGLKVIAGAPEATALGAIETQLEVLGVASAQELATLRPAGRTFHPGGS